MRSGKDRDLSKKKLSAWPEKKKKKKELQPGFDKVVNTRTARKRSPGRKNAQGKAKRTSERD